MKQLALFLSVLVLLSLLAGCAGDQSPETTAAPATTAPIPTLAPETENTVPSSTEAPEPETTTVPETTLSPEELERLEFYHLFRQLDPDETDRWLAENPQYFENGYFGIAVNEAWLTDSGLDLYTTQGDQVLAIDAENGILILRVYAAGSRGVLAIAKHPSRLHLCVSQNLGTMGEKIGSIAQRNNGLLAMTGSGFLDPEGRGNGGEMAGACRSDGKDYGTPFGWNYARFELLENNWAVVTHADGSPSQYTTDSMEFEPALLIDGETQPPGIWTGENPRACIGQTKHGEILMLGIEGRFDDSPGCSVTECAKIMLNYDGWNAINVDGGTTAIVWYRGEPILRCSNRSTPDGRYLPTAWVYTKAEDGE